MAVEALDRAGRCDLGGKFGVEGWNGVKVRDKKGCLAPFSAVAPSFRAG